MYTATVKNKEFINGAIKVTVDFSDGVTTVTETCIPQDKNGFTHWVKSRLATFNGGQEIDAEYAVDTPVDLTVPPVTPPTQAELDMGEWFSDFRRMERVQKLIDLGIIPSDHAKVTALRTKLQNNLLASYIDAL